MEAPDLQCVSSKCPNGGYNTAFFSNNPFGAFAQMHSAQVQSAPTTELTNISVKKLKY